MRIKGSNTCVRSHSSLHVLFTVTTLAVNNDDGRNWEWLRDYLSASTMQSDCMVLSSTCQFLTNNSLQSADKDQQEMRAVAEKPHDAIVKLDRLGGRIKIHSDIAWSSLR